MDNTKRFRSIEADHLSNKATIFYKIVEEMKYKDPVILYLFKTTK